MRRHLAVVAAVPAAAVLLAGVALADTVTVSDMTFFTSPSGNIGCSIEPGFVRCDIREREWSPPARPADCYRETGFGQGITLHTGTPAAFVCGGDSTFGAGEPLAYGDKIMAGPIECTSLESGMQCWDVQYGGSFTLSRQGYDLG